MHVIVISLNDSSVMISWRPPNIPNGIITTYNVMIFKLEGNTGILNMNTTSDSQTTSMVFDLGMLELFVNIILIVYNMMFRCWNTI